MTVLMCFVVWFSYAFFISAGTLTKAPSFTRFHEVQARAFMNGRLDLSKKLSPSYVEQNPEWDMSPYKGKRYMYFGPAPAVVMVLVKSLGGPSSMPDQIVAVVFACMRFGFCAALMFLCWRRYLPTMPAGFVFAGLCVLAWGTPVSFMLGRAAVYEASIFACQAFVAAGLYCSLQTIRQDGWRCALFASLCGTALGFAVASRLTVVPAAGVVALATALVLLPDTSPWRSRRRRFVAVCAPLLVCVIAMGMFNAARFDSPFESGQRHSHTIQTPDKAHPRYVAANLYNYFLRAPDVSSEFPFIRVPWRIENPLPEWLNNPRGSYFTEPMIGLPYVLPFGVFALFGLTTVIRALLRLRKRAAEPDDVTAGTDLALLGSFAMTVLPTLPLLVYFAATMRYLGDGCTGITILATLSLGLAWQRWQHRRRAFRAIVICAVVLTTAWTVIVAFLLWTLSYYNFLPTYNPELFARLQALF